MAERDQQLGRRYARPPDARTAPPAAGDGERHDTTSKDGLLVHIPDAALTEPAAAEHSASTPAHNPTSTRGLLPALVVRNTCRQIAAPKQNALNRSGRVPTAQMPHSGITPPGAFGHLRRSPTLPQQRMATAPLERGHLITFTDDAGSTLARLYLSSQIYVCRFRRWDDLCVSRRVLALSCSEAPSKDRPS